MPAPANEMRMKIRKFGRFSMPRAVPIEDPPADAAAGGVAGRKAPTTTAMTTESTAARTRQSRPSSPVLKTQRQPVRK